MEEDSHESEEGEEGKKYYIKPLTKYEQTLREKAHERHKQNIVHEQKCWGKTFVGAAFISKPDKILFKDFDVGQTYTQTVVLTNVSYTFNSFKLLPLDGDIKEFFEIEFSPPGRLSAGLTCPIVIAFTPKMNKDITSTFPILSETGRIDLPLLCTSKKALISADPPITDSFIQFDIGSVILGEQGKKVLTLINSGALDCTFTLLSKDGEPIQNPQESSFALTERSGQTNMSGAHGAADLEGLEEPVQFFAQTSFPKEGQIEGYATSTVPFTFAPVLLDEYEEEVLIVFSNKDVEPIRLILRAASTDVPLSVEKSVYDLLVCPINHIYREKIVLQNRSTKPMKVQLTFPREARDHLEFNPTLGYVQGNATFEIWCKFKPDQNAYIMLKEFQQDESNFQIPIQVTSPNQVLPVDFFIQAELTVDSLSVSPPQLDFKEVYVSAASRVPFTISNNSLVSQEYAFCRLPGTISIEPQDGFGTILPRETLELSAVYRPAPVKPGTELGKDTAEFALRSRCGTICSREVRIPYVAKLSQCPIKFSKLRVECPALPPGEFFEIVTELVNVSKKAAYAVEIVPPPFGIAGITVNPKVIPSLGVGERIRVMLKFSADYRDYNELKSKVSIPTEGQAPGPTLAERGLTLESLGGSCTNFNLADPDSRSQHYTWLLPVYFRPALTEDPAKRTYLEVRTVTVSRTLEVDPAVANFGEIAVSCRKLITVNVRNKAAQGVVLRTDTLPPFCGFRVMNAMRKVESGGNFSLVVEFEPSNQQLFEETLLIRSGLSVASVKLVGRGVRPEVKLRPQDGLLNCGYVVVENTLEKSFFLQNASSFPFTFTLIKRSSGTRNYSGLYNFVYIPHEKTLNPAEECEVKVRFSPDHVSEAYFEHLLIEVPNQIEPKEIYIAGCCVTRSVYVKYDYPFKWPSSQELTLRPENPLQFLEQPKPALKQLTLIFRKEDGAVPDDLKEECRLRRIVIGNSKMNDGKQDKAGGFEVLMPVNAT